MKNRVSDVRDHLVAMLEALNDPDTDDKVVERARAATGIAGAYINAVRVELDAHKLADQLGVMPEAVGPARLVDTGEGSTRRHRMIGGRMPDTGEG